MRPWHEGLEIAAGCKPFQYVALPYILRFLSSSQRYQLIGLVVPAEAKAYFNEPELNRRKTKCTQEQIDRDAGQSLSALH